MLQHSLVLRFWLKVDQSEKANHKYHCAYDSSPRMQFHWQAFVYVTSNHELASQPKTDKVKGGKHNSCKELLYKAQHGHKNKSAAPDLEFLRSVVIIFSPPQNKLNDSSCGFSTEDRVLDVAYFSKKSRGKPLWRMMLLNVPIFSVL